MEPQEVSGRVLGIGIDIIECHRIAQMIEKHEEAFLQRVFTQREIEYCSSRRSSNQHYAGRWAAKEAVLKVLGTGWTKGIMWTDIEVFNEAGGKPTIILTGHALRIAEDLGIKSVMITISHCRAYAVAYANGIS